MPVTDPTKSRAPKYKGDITLTALGDEDAVTRSSGVDLSPYEGIISTSYSKHTSGHQKPGVGVNLPTEAVPTAQTRFRMAARKLGVGVAFDTYTHESPRGQQIGLQPGQTRLVVSAKPKKVFKPKDAQTVTAPAAAPASKGLPTPAARK